jgi:hypothetical protein
MYIYIIYIYNYIYVYTCTYIYIYIQDLLPLHCTAGWFPKWWGKGGAQEEPEGGAGSGILVVY